MRGYPRGEYARFHQSISQRRSSWRRLSQVSHKTILEEAVF